MSSRNPFALLSDDNDVSDNEQKTLPKATKPVTVDSAPKSGKQTSRTAPIPAATARRNVPGQTTVRPQKEANELPASDAPAGDKGQFEGERGRDSRGTGFGRGRGGRGGRGGERAPRGDRTEGGRGGARGGRAPRAERPDRHSQTDRVDSNKAEHQGWGGDDGKRELENENAGVTDAAAEKTADGADGAAPAAAPEADKAPEAPAEPEDTSKTYDEYRKEQKAAGRGVLDNLTVEGRKANEGADDSQWKDGVAITKPDVDEGYFADLQKDKANKARKERKEKNFLEVEFQSAPRRDAGSERGGRGGRGGRGRGDGAPRGRGAGGRGRGGRGGAGSASSQANGVNFSDNNAFPSLA